MATKPQNIIYGVNDKLSPIPLFFYGLQMASCSAGSLVMPVVIARAAGASNHVAISLVAVSMLAWAIGAIIQAYPKLGSGYLAIPNNSGTYLAPSILAAQSGGLALMAGMTLFGGLCHAALARILQHIRRWLPPEIGAVVLLLIGIQLGTMGLDEMFEQKGPDPIPGVTTEFIGALTLAIMLVCTLGFKKTLGRYCVLIGIAFGYVLTLFLSHPKDSLKLSLLTDAPWFGIPQFAISGYHFQAALIIPFFMAGLISAVKSTSLITAAQKANDANWRKPDMDNICKGNIADGVGCFISGLFGSMGQNISSSSVGVPVQTGVTCRSIAYSFAAIFGVLAFCPKFVTVFLAIPDSIIGAMLVFTGVTVFMSGQQMLSLKELTNRMSILVGLSFLLGLCFPLHPEYYAQLPHWVSKVTGSSYTIAALSGIFLNACFQLGARKKLQFSIHPSQEQFITIDKAIHDFIVANDIPREMIYNASLAVKSALISVMKENLVRDEVDIAVYFNGVELKVLISYHGNALTATPVTSMAQFADVNNSGSDLLHDIVDWHKTHYRRGKTRLTYGFEI